MYFWDVHGTVPSFSLKSEIRGLELPKGTILEIEIVHELQGEVRFFFQLLLFLS